MAGPPTTDTNDRLGRSYCVQTPTRGAPVGMVPQCIHSLSAIAVDCEQMIRRATILMCTHIQLVADVHLERGNNAHMRNVLQISQLEAPRDTTRSKRESTFHWPLIACPNDIVCRFEVQLELFVNSELLPTLVSLQTTLQENGKKNHS